MKDFVNNTIYYSLKKNVFSIIFNIVMFSILYTIGGFLFFDVSRINSFYGSKSNMPGWDYYIIDAIGVEGVAIQGYLFTYFFLVVLIIITFVLDAYITYKKDKDVISLLKVKGYSFIYSNGLFWLVKCCLFFVSSIIAILLFLIILIIVNMNLGTQMPVLIIDHNVFIQLIVFNVLHAIINLPFYIISFSEKELIKTIRNFY